MILRICDQDCWNHGPWPLFERHQSLRYRRREHAAGGSSASGHIGRCRVKTGAGASTDKRTLINVTAAIFNLSVFFSSIFHMAIPVPFLPLAILLILDGRPAAVRAVHCGGYIIVGFVEGPDGCISSRSRPDQSSCSIGWVIAVAHRRPAAVRAV